QGGSALATPAVADELKLTEAQKGQVADILQKQRSAMMEMFQNQGQGGDRQAAMQKMQAMRTETDTKLLAVLTDPQKAQWKDMQGTPLPLAPLQGRPRGQGT